MAEFRTKKTMMLICTVCLTGTWLCICTQIVCMFAMEVLLAIAGACEMVLCLWGSVLCCATGQLNKLPLWLVGSTISSPNLTTVTDCTTAYLFLG